MKNNNKIILQSSIVPIVLYSNAGLQKKLIKQENKAKAGIYRWVNLINGKQYIGSSLNLSKRLSDYFSALASKNMETKLKRSKSAIYSALIKHGCYNFSLEILEYCSVENLIQREQFYIDSFEPSYNICKTAGSTLGRICSEETRAKISATNLGKTRSEESRANMKDAKMGNSNSKNQPNAQQILVTDLELNTKTIYKSIHEASRALNIAQPSISKYFTRNQIKPYKKRYVFTKI
jgi:group I intron endonuclease